MWDVTMTIFDVCSFIVENRVSYETSSLRALSKDGNSEW